MMLKLNLLPVDELKTINAKHMKHLRLLIVIFAFMLVVASVVVLGKLYSLSRAQRELSEQVNELTNLEANQKETLDNLHKQQENITGHIAKDNNNLDVAEFLRLLVHLKAPKVVIYEIKAATNQIDLTGFSNNRASVLEFSEQLKKSSQVLKVANFAITKTNKNSEQNKYPLAFSITAIMKVEGKQK